MEWKSFAVQAALNTFEEAAGSGLRSRAELARCLAAVTMTSLITAGIEHPRLREMDELISLSELSTSDMVAHPKLRSTWEKALRHNFRGLWNFPPDCATRAAINAARAADCACSGDAEASTWLSAVVDLALAAGVPNATVIKTIKSRDPRPARSGA